MILEPVDRISVAQVTVTSAAPIGIVPPGPSIPKQTVVRIKALAANTGIIWIGGSDVTTSNGWPLYKGEETAIPLSRVDGLFLLAGTNGDKVAVMVY